MLSKPNSSQTSVDIKMTKEGHVPRREHTCVYIDTDIRFLSSVDTGAQRKEKNVYACRCLSECVWACAGVCVHVWACVCMCAFMHVCMCACAREHDLTVERGLQKKRNMKGMGRRNQGG